MHTKTFATLVLIVFSITAQVKLPAEAWITDDFASARNEASRDGKKVCVLYKKMRVTVLEKSKEKETIGDKTDYWYKIKSKDVTGWTFGALLDFKNLPKDAYETYYTDPGMEWFYNRYNYSTWEELELNMTDFTLDEYRSLLTAATSEDRVSWLLYNSLYSNLKSGNEKFNNPPFPYLKEILLSPEFLSKICYTSYYEGEPQFSQAAMNIFRVVESQVTDQEKLYLDITKYGPPVFSYLPEELQKNRKFIIKLSIQNPENFSFIPNDMKNDENVIKEILTGLWNLTGKKESVYTLLKYKVVLRLESKLKLSYDSYVPGK